MVLVMIPLVGAMELGPYQLGMIGMAIGTTALNHDIKVSGPVWKKLNRMKFNGRFRNVDDILRLTYGLPPEGKPVKRYSDESEDYAESYA